MSSATGKAEKFASLTLAQSCLRFSFAQIQSATKHFDHELVIGQGGYGKVYKGRIFIQDTSHVVAIKRLDSESKQGAHEFTAEIEMLSKLRHSHLVSLLGYCNEYKEMILVYVYMPHGTLYHHLHKAHTHLSWVQRLKIAIGAACGLNYLHTGVGTRHGVIHRDVKTSNILLDGNWEAKISDFGLSRVGPINQLSSYVDVSVKGTFGYLDPEYFLTRKLTRKTDVYAFGVVLLELLSGRIAVDERNAEEHYSLVRWAQTCMKERKLDQMVDSNIRGTVYPKCLRGFAQLAYRCLRSFIEERPAMAEVVVSLRTLLELQQRHHNFAERSSINRFTWKINNFLVSATKQNADQCGKSPSKRPGSNLNGSNLNRFTYYELTCATKNFGMDTCLNPTILRLAYKGWIDKTTYSTSKHYTGFPIVIRRINSLNLLERLDLEALKKFSHPNLVKLIGYCSEGAKIFFVHEFVPNGNFEELLHSGGVSRLPLVTKSKIAVGIARGIVFLHKTLKHVSEFRLDRHNILLDKDFMPKISDYDDTSVVVSHCPQSNRAFGNLNYPSNRLVYGRLQSNLSSFTVLFAEVLTGKQISNHNEFQTIDDLSIKQGKLSLVDIAKLCFKTCNEADSESKLLRILEEYEQCIRVSKSNT